MLLAAQQAADNHVIVHGCDESSLVGGIPRDPLAHMHSSSKGDFLQVHNEQSFTPLLWSIMSTDIPFQQIFEKHYLGDSSLNHDKKRGNHQVNFGFACGQSHAKRTPKMIAQHYGVSVPATLEGTDSMLVLTTFLAMSKLAKATGVEWTQEEYLQEHPEVVARLKLFADTLVPGNVFEAITAAFLPLDGVASVLEHTDKQNCPELTSVLIASRIMKCDDGRCVTLLL